VAAPLAGWPSRMPLPIVLAPALIAAAFVVSPWRWSRDEQQAVDDWQPSRRFVWTAAAIAAATVYWLVLTRFQSGEINGIDFTVYFDRPLFQTIHGKPLFVESADPIYAYRSSLGTHAFWSTLPLAIFYAIYPSPQWLLALSAACVVAGAVYVLRIMQRLGAGGVLSVATAAAFVLSDNTARTLNYGFHPEVLYAWFIPWLIDAGLARRRLSFTVAAAACISVKEDAFMPLFAAAVALAFLRGRQMSAGDRLTYLVLPTAAALVNVGVYYKYVVPMYTAGGQPTYAGIWANYGSAPLPALLAMATQPLRVLRDATTSGLFETVIAPHLFLPFIGWHWIVGAAPIMLLYGASGNDQLRAFGIYYAIVLLPFLTIGASIGALAIARRTIPATSAFRARWAAAVLVVAGVFAVGSGYNLRPWKTEISHVSDAMRLLDAEPVVLVQSGLYPHAGYESRVKLLSPETLRDPALAGAAVLLAASVDAYPFDTNALEALRQQPPIGRMPAGLVAVRRPR
jgi:uncharacterized membrane protein